VSSSPTTVQSSPSQTISVFDFDISGARLHMGGDELINAVTPSFPGSTPQVTRCNDAGFGRTNFVCSVQIRTDTFEFRATFSPRINLAHLRPSNAPEIATFIMLQYINAVPSDVEQNFFSSARQKYGAPVRFEFPRALNGEWTWVYCNPCGREDMRVFQQGLPNLRINPGSPASSAIQYGPRAILEDTGYLRSATDHLRNERERFIQNQQRGARPPL
jgi:hypothetical protein